MSYRKNFILTWKGRADRGVLREALREITGYSAWADLADLGVHLEDATWYAAAADMQALSQRFPEIRFGLFVDAEDGEQWIIDAWRGATDTRHAVRHFPPRTLFDPEPRPRRKQPHNSRFRTSPPIPPQEIPSCDI